MTTGSYPNEYFDAFGAPKEWNKSKLIDAYRFHMAAKYLLPGSVLDVGAYRGEFLRYIDDGKRQLFGTDVNQERVDFIDRQFGRSIARLDFRNGDLVTFDDASVDNVVCTEVIEHVHDDRHAVAELCRVARRRIVLSVPYMETIRFQMCVHCGQFTPNAGHLHSYEKDSVESLLPEGWRVVRKVTMGRRLTRAIGRRLPFSTALAPLAATVDFLTPGRGMWLMVVIDREHIGADR